MAAKDPFFNVTARTPPPEAAAATGRSLWHSPVPYLFGGLAAMLGLIAFALLILACSYWKLSGYLEDGSGGETGEGRDLEAGEGTKNGDVEKRKVPFEEKVLVIMAGQLKPTCLATPMSSRQSSFGDNGSDTSCCCGEKSSNSDNFADEEAVKQGSSGGGGDQVQSRSNIHESSLVGTH